MNSDEIIEILSTIKHPETDTDIATSGILHEVRIDADKINVSLIFKSNDAFVASIKEAVAKEISLHYPSMEIKVSAIRKENPPVKKKEIPEIGLAKVKHIIAVASGKGGVGKSTVSTNLAVALARAGYKTGLVDADLYGPSIPKMFGIEGAQPAMVNCDGYELIEPVERFDVRILSIGFFVSADDPVIWRGPMAVGALRQLTKQGNWGEIDYLIVDLPPGTGDIHITLVQELQFSAAVIVTTPQEVALADAIKGVNMFLNPKINVPIAGLVENMAWFTPAELPDNKYYIFGKDGGRQMAEQLNIQLLGQIPLIQSIREGGDSGSPIAVGESSAANIFDSIAQKVIDFVEKKNT
jgi:ATP-binding protein involved in chromosome partitioning